jgi:hypothetical protein
MRGQSWSAAVIRLAFVQVQYNPLRASVSMPGLIIRLSPETMDSTRVDDLCPSHWLLRPDCQPFVIGGLEHFL